MNLVRTAAFLGLAFAALCTAGLAALGVLFLPGKDRDKANLLMRVEMGRVAREWGGLAPFPATARHFTIRTEGSMFTRSFRGSFSDTPARVRRWLDASPGVGAGGRDPQ